MQGMCGSRFRAFFVKRAVWVSARARSGSVRWQVGDYTATTSLSTFTNVELRNREIWAFNFDGGLYQIDPDSGAILASKLV